MSELQKFKTLIENSQQFVDGLNQIPGVKASLGGASIEITADSPKKQGRIYKADVVKQWRGRGLGRLYWREDCKRWRNWESGAVAVAIKGAVRVWFMNRQAILDYLNGE